MDLMAVNLCTATISMFMLTPSISLKLDAMCMYEVFFFCRSNLASDPFSLFLLFAFHVQKLSCKCKVVRKFSCLFLRSWSIASQVDISGAFFYLQLYFFSCLIVFLVWLYLSSCLFLRSWYIATQVDISGAKKNSAVAGLRSFWQFVFVIVLEIIFVMVLEIVFVMGLEIVFVFALVCVLTIQELCDRSPEISHAASPAGRGR